MRVDIHQHLWPEPFLEALSRRQSPPFLQRSGCAWVLHVEGEAEYIVDLADHDPGARAERIAEDGLDLALICSSSPLGVEALPTDEANELLVTYHDALQELPDCFGAWGAVAVSDPDPDEVDCLLDRGFAGVSLPAGALATTAGLERCGPLLERLERREAPLLVHPGPAPWRRHANGNVLAPDWWPAMTDYLFDLHAAWHAFIAAGRRSHPRLNVAFVALAGGAPLHVERLASRNGGHATATDGRIFFETSSYGSKAIDAVVRSVGVEQLVFGSDRPVIEPADTQLGAAADALMLGDNVHRLIGRLPIAL